MEQTKYDKPRVTDYGSLKELTESCYGGHGGDAAFPSGYGNGLPFGKEYVTSRVQCHEV
jgi:hypothetical protein